MLWNRRAPRCAVDPFDTTEDDDDELTQAWCKALQAQPVDMDELLGETLSINLYVTITSMAS